MPGNHSTLDLSQKIDVTVHLVQCFKISLALGNLLANVLGIFVVEIISNYSVSPSSMALNKISEQIDKIYLPITFVIIFIFTFIYEGPVRTFLNNKYQGTKNGKTLSLKAGQRVLNSSQELSPQ